MRSLSVRFQKKSYCINENNNMLQIQKITLLLRSCEPPRFLVSVCWWVFGFLLNQSTVGSCGNNDDLHQISAWIVSELVGSFEISGSSRDPMREGFVAKLANWLKKFLFVLQLCDHKLGYYLAAILMEGGVANNDPNHKVGYCYNFFFVTIKSI
jgi:hypothetical protein